jgi:hypothetical protein
VTVRVDISRADKNRAVISRVVISRSYLADGRVVRWHAPDDRPWAIDAELASQPVPPALARRTGTGDPGAFWPRWTALETVCKLLDEPVHLRLRRLGLDGGRADGITTWTLAYSGVIITIGNRAG